MKRFIKSLFCFILCAFLLAGCTINISGKDITFDRDSIKETVDAIIPKDVTGEMREVTITPSDRKTVRELEIENISFTKTNAKIFIFPAENGETRIEAEYPAFMEDYGFAITMRDGEIKIGTPKVTDFKAGEFEIYIYADIESIDISGGIAVEMDASAAQRIDIDIKGGASFYIYNADAEYLEADIAGAASMDLSGAAENFEIELAGAGSLDAKNLICKNAEVIIDGAGAAEISVTDNLLADLDGVGSLEYYGDPVLTNISAGLTNIEQVSKEVYGG